MNKQQEIKLRKLIRKQLSEEFLNEDWRTEKNKWSSTEAKTIMDDSLRNWSKQLKKVKYILCDITKKKILKKKIQKSFTYVVNLGGYVDHSNKIKTYKSHYIGCKN